MIVKKQMYGTNQTEKTSPFPHFLIFAFLCPNTPLFKGPIFFANTTPVLPPLIQDCSANKAGKRGNMSRLLYTVYVDVRLESSLKFFIAISKGVRQHIFVSYTEGGWARITLTMKFLVTVPYVRINREDFCAEVPTRNTPPFHIVLKMNIYPPKEDP